MLIYLNQITQKTSFDWTKTKSKLKASSEPSQITNYKDHQGSPASASLLHSWHTFFSTVDFIDFFRKFFLEENILNKYDTQLNNFWGCFRFISIALRVVNRKNWKCQSKISFIILRIDNFAHAWIYFLKIFNGKILFLFSVENWFHKFRMFSRSLKVFFFLFGGNNGHNHAQKMDILATGRSAHDFKCEIYSNYVMSEVSTGHFFSFHPENYKLPFLTGNFLIFLADGGRVFE